MKSYPKVILSKLQNKVQRRIEKLKRDESDSDDILSDTSVKTPLVAQNDKLARFKTLSTVATNAKANDAPIGKVKEESFEANHKNFESSITCKGRNNPIRNGKIDNIIKEMVDEAIYERQYQMKMRKLYSTERGSKDETSNLESEQNFIYK